MVLVIIEGFFHSMKVKHLQEEVHYTEWGIYQSKSSHIEETIDRQLGQKQIYDRYQFKGT